MRIRRGKLIPREDGKRIEEFVGAAHTGTRAVSVARMLAPPGWKEPAQRPEFDEAVCVLRGTLTLVVEGKRERIAAGEVGWVPRGNEVVYRNDAAEACDYYSICTPAFLPGLAHMDPAPPPPAKGTVRVDVSHPAGSLHARALAAAARRFLGSLPATGAELSVSLVTDRAIQRLNRTWRKKDEPTDVLSFPAGDAPPGSPGPRLLGDVVISLDTAVRQARERGRPLKEELTRYLAHGLLHLLGHDHERPGEARRMAVLEDALVGGAGMVTEAGLVPRKPRARRSTRSPVDI